MNSIKPITVTRQERQRLEGLLGVEPSRIALRAKIILLCVGGSSATRIQQVLGLSFPTISLWRRRFKTERLNGLYDRARSGRKKKLTAKKIKEVLKLAATKTTSTRGWSLRKLAKATGLSHTTISRVLQESNCK